VNEIVTVTPWHPWPLAIPIVIAIGGIVVSSIGTRRHSKPVRELGSAIFFLAALGALAMFGFMPGSWDQGARADALIGLGYESPTFSAEQITGPGEPAVIAFQAERDGERVRGFLKSTGGDQWQVTEVEEDD
jgi:hypothetical protein